jgi:hypothetical protein
MLEHFLIPQALAVEALDPPGSCTSFFDDGGLFTGGTGAGFNCIADYVDMITYIVLGFGTSIALIMLMYSGIQYITSSVTPGGSTDAAKKGISSALIGLAIAMLAYLIIDTIVSTLTQG